MFSAKRIVTIIGTLFAAFGIGYVMHNMMRPAPPTGAAVGVQVASVSPVIDPVPDIAPQADEDAPIAVATAIPVPPAGAPQPERLPEAPVTLAALRDQPTVGLSVGLPAEEPAPGFGCEITLSAQPVAAAMVNLALSAPCLVNERFTLHHSGMMFAAATDDTGAAKLSVPALSKAAVFIATFGSGASAVAEAEISTLEYYDRAVVQWSGPEGLQIHALEYGADYGEAGHVWAGAAHDLARAAKGEGGFLTRLGDPDIFNPLRAEVYTFPTGTAVKAGDILLSLEAEVTEGNCAHSLEAQVLQKSGTARMQVRELALTMPDCEAVGDFLVLKNLFDDLNIARN